MNEEETWADVPGYEDILEVSNLGRVKSKERVRVFSDNKPDRLVGGKILKFQLDRRGYPRLRFNTVSGEKKSLRIHRMVAMAFIPNPDNLPQVNHKDGCKENNRVSNLEWCTNRYNMRHSHDAGLHIHETGSAAARFTGAVAVYKEGVRINTLYGNLDMANKGFDFRLVSACLLGKRKTHRGCTFIKEQQ